MMIIMMTVVLVLVVVVIDDDDDDEDEDDEDDDDDDDVPRSKAISFGILHVLLFKLEVITNVTKRNNSNTIIRLENNNTMLLTYLQ